ncbi:MAG: oligosaccharide flippase family protein [Candidatus Omnitrophica bacterium]|nr:oligosaccharide flippase family protein [Candidatus Omnitrophota bacterium]MBU1870210.1 oligosaccharide flippase family protein [Candidatus Omnitrophota bacterium]
MIKKSFFSHSFDLILSQGILAVSGVLFWVIAARLYTVEGVGLGSVLISLASFLIFISSLGVLPSFIRFMPIDKDKGKLVGTLFGFSQGLLIIFVMIFLSAKGILLPKVRILNNPWNSLLFIIFVLSMQTFQILDSVFVSLQRTRLVLAKNATQYTLRIVFLFILTALGGFGIFSSNCLSAIVAVVLSAGYLLLKYKDLKIKWGFDPAILKRVLPFSLVNFLNALTLSLPGMIAPLAILSLFSEKEAGLFYIPWMMFSVYCSFISSVNNVFLMKASHGEDHPLLLKKAVTFSFILSIFGFLAFFILGDKILFLFKKDFSEHSFLTLRLLFSSIFFFVFNQIYITTLNIKKQNGRVALFAGFVLALLTILGFILLPSFGGKGMALSWLFANIMGSIFVFLLWFLKRGK